MPAAVIGGIIAGAGAIGGSAIASHGANTAAQTQAQAADTAAQLQAQEAQNALDFQKSQFSTTQQEIAPFLNTGYGALANLGYLAGVLPQSFNAGEATATVPGGPSTGAQPAALQAAFNPTDFGPRGEMLRDGSASFDNTNTPFSNWATGGSTVPSVGATAGGPGANGINVPANLSSLINPNLGGFGSLLQPFQAPTNVTEQNDPGYKFRLDTGLQQLENSAAARGGLLSGGTEKALQDWAQNDASNEYGNVYNRAFNTFETNQQNTWNRLAALAGIGQGAVGTSAAAGQNAAGNVTNIDLTAGSQIGSNINAAGAARGTGYLNSGNIWGNAFTGTGSNLGLLYMLSQIGKNPTANGPGPDPFLG